jgi:hypothetical protein
VSRDSETERGAGTEHWRPRPRRRSRAGGFRLVRCPAPCDQSHLVRGTAAARALCAGGGRQGGYRGEGTLRMAVACFVAIWTAPSRSPISRVPFGATGERLLEARGARPAGNPGRCRAPPGRDSSPRARPRAAAGRAPARAPIRAAIVIGPSGSFFFSSLPSSPWWFRAGKNEGADGDRWIGRN